jgi:hypothetical protein
MVISQKDITRFWAKVDIRGEDECWLWKFGKFPSGYGQFWIRNTSVYASRIAYCIENSLDPFEIEEWVLHSCDVRPCCNPKHLRGGTPKENSCDREIRNRSNRSFGEEAPRSKLTETEIQKICELRKEGYTQWSIGSLFKVSQAQISRIINHKNWKHLAKLQGCDKLMKSSKRINIGEWRI